MGEMLQVVEEQEMDIDNFEIADTILFAQLKEPAFTVNGNKISVNAASVRLLSEVEYVKILVNRTEKILVLKPCSEIDIFGYNWAKTKNGRRYATQRTGLPFVLSLCKMMDWDPDCRYKVMGKKMYAKGEAILAFDLMQAQPFRKPDVTEKSTAAKRPVLPFNWSGSFGPKYGETKRTLQVNTFAGFTVFSIKNNAEQRLDDNNMLWNETESRI